MHGVLKFEIRDAFSNNLRWILKLLLYRRSAILQQTLIIVNLVIIFYRQKYLWLRRYQITKKAYLNQMRVAWGIFWYIYTILEFPKFWLTDIFIKHNYFHFYQSFMTCLIHIRSHNAKLITFCCFSVKARSCCYWTWMFVYLKVFFLVAILYFVNESKFWSNKKH